MDIRNRSCIEITLMSDSHSYSETLMTLSAIHPSEILVQDGTQKKVLTEKILKQVSVDVTTTRVLFISRQYFDQDRGADMLKKVLVEEVDADLIAKYIVLAGTYCLLRYVENCSGCSFPNHGLRLVYTSQSSTRLSIDRNTAMNLELISEIRSGNQKDSLYGAINMTKTVVGARLLKSNILRPLTDISTLESRFDVIELFLRNPPIYTKVSQMLPHLPEMDKCLSGLITVPKKITQKSAAVSIETLIMLKSAIKQAFQLGKLLADLNGGEDECRSLLLSATIDNFQDENLMRMLDSIDAMLTESTNFSKNSLEMKQNECFAIKTGVNARLDIARVTFLDSVENIYLLASEYSQMLETAVKVHYNTARGYFLQIPASIVNLPAVFIQAVQQRKSISCTTEEVSSLSDRAAESIGEALLITHDILQELLESIRQNMGAVFTLTDSIALVDMLVSFADLVAFSPLPFTRPVLKIDGPMVIRRGRHLIVESSQKQHFVENDTFISALKNVQIITGKERSTLSV